MIEKIVNSIGGLLSTLKISKGLFVFCFLFGGGVILAWFYYTYQYSVNMLFSDSWDYSRVFIDEFSVFQQFFHQHGPQRMGLGLVITGILHEFSYWDSKWISFCVAILIFMSTVIYLLTKYKLFGKLNSYDVIIVALTLTLNQFEVLTISPFLSHSAIPVVFISLFGLSLTIKPLITRNILLFIISINLIFSSFGFFITPVFILLLSLEIIKAVSEKNRKEIIVGISTLFILLITILLFFKGYDSNYVAHHVILDFKQAWNYLFYISLSYAGVFGIRGIGVVPITTGMFLFGVVCFVFVDSCIKLMKYSRTDSVKKIILNKILLVLTSYSILFSINLAFGRLEFGLALSQSSRYIPYLIPSLIGVFFYVNNLAGQGKNILIHVIFIFMLVSQYLSRNNTIDMKAWYDMKTTWKTEYLKCENANQADSLSNFSVHPNNESIEKTLKYLKENKLNLFKESK